MKKLLLLLMVVAVIGGGVTCSGSDGTQPEIVYITAVPEAQTPTPTKETEYTTVAHWEGTSSKTTGPFFMASEPWALLWAFSPNESYNSLSIFVHKVGDDWFLELPVNLVNAPSPISDNSFIYETGTFYLEITGLFGYWVAEVGNWQ